MQAHAPHDGDGRLQGQVIILFALASVLLIGMMALAVDMGFLLAERRQIQAAADAGVPAGDVEVNRPPTSGRFAGDNAYIEVVITKDVQRFFLEAVYTGEWSVTSRAVAIVESVGVDVALLALNPDSSGIQTSGVSWIETIGGSMVSNYNINASGSSKISANNVFFYFTNGGYRRSNGMSSFAFTPPTSQIYPGYYPGGVSLFGCQQHCRVRVDRLHLAN